MKDNERYVISKLFKWFSNTYWVILITLLILKIAGVVQWKWKCLFIAFAVYIVAYGVLFIFTAIGITIASIIRESKKTPVCNITIDKLKTIEREWEDAFILEAGKEWRRNPKARHLMKRIKQNERRLKKIIRIEQGVHNQ